MDFLFVIPGAAGAFRLKEFRQYCKFNHDTLTEDLDISYVLHENGLKILYDRRAVVFTQDPASLHSYINQMRRWFGGGWQCFMKHKGLAVKEPKVALELSLMYLEGIIFSILLFITPFLSLKFFGTFIASYLVVAFAFAIFAAYKERRPSLLLIPFPYLLLVVINAYIFLEQAFKEVVLGRKNLTWFKPERVEM